MTFLELAWIAISVLELRPAVLLDPLCVVTGLVIFPYLVAVKR